MSFFRSLFGKNSQKEVIFQEVANFDETIAQNHWVRGEDFIGLFLENLGTLCPKLSYQDASDYISALTSELQIRIVNSEIDSYIDNRDVIPPEDVYIKISDAIELSTNAGKRIGIIKEVLGAARLRNGNGRGMSRWAQKRYDHIRNHSNISTLSALRTLFQNEKTCSTDQLEKSHDFTLYKKDDKTPPPFYSSTDGDISFRFALRRGKNSRVTRVGYPLTL